MDACSCCIASHKHVTTECGATIFVAGAAAGAAAAALMCAVTVKGLRPMSTGLESSSELRLGEPSGSTTVRQVEEEEEEKPSPWRIHPPKVLGAELWRTKSLAEGSLQEIMDCEDAPLRAGRASADPDDFWSGSARRATMLAACPRIRPRLSSDGLVRFEVNGRPLTQRGFLQTFAEPRLEPGGNVGQTRAAWVPAVAAAQAFRMAVMQSCGDGSGGVYWKGPGFTVSSLDNEFVALCCGTAAPLSSRGDGTKFTVNPATGTEKAEFMHVHPIRIGPETAPVRVPGTHGFCKFKSPSSTLIVPGRTRKHRCAAPVPVAGVWGGVRNCDGMAHLAVAMQARNARVTNDGSLVRDQLSDYLVNDEELAMGLRLVAQEIIAQLYGDDAESTGVGCGARAERRIWWCTHGHDIPWFHFKIMSTQALLAKSGKGPLKEQYSEEHLRLLGYGPNAQPLDQLPSQAPSS